MKTGEKLKEFILYNDRGEQVDDKSLLGKYTVLFFFPKAFTPGCTRECIAFSDKGNIKLELNPELSIDETEWEENGFASNIEINDEDINWIGVSADKPETMRKFREKYDLKIELLSDSEKMLAKELGAFKSMGGITRSTFIFDKTGRLRYFWEKVSVSGHIGQVAEKIREILEYDGKISPVIEDRRAKRGMSSRKIPRMAVKTIIEAGTFAPSCANKQPWKFTVIDDDILLEKVREGLSAGNYWAKNAPVLVAVHGGKSEDCEFSDNRDYLLFDLGLAVENMLLQSVHMGLYAHPMAGFDPLKIKPLLRIPENDILIAVIAIAHPGSDEELSEKHRQQENSERIRKPIEEIMSWNEE